MHLAFSYDEEIGCLGAHSLAERLVGSVPRPQAVIVGEPTMMSVVNAQNAGGGIISTFSGVEAHSSMTNLGVSAIRFADDFIHWLNELQPELAARKRSDIDTVPGHTTINVGIVSGGTAANILARECTLNWGYRTLPDDDPWEVQRRAETYIAELLLPRIRARHPRRPSPCGDALSCPACCRGRTSKRQNSPCNGPAATAPMPCPAAPRRESSAGTAYPR
jgi:acetylornithine deacetylase